MSYQELAGSPKESLSESGGPGVTRQFLIPWENRVATAYSLSGTSYPGLPHMRCSGIAMQPFVDDMAPNPSLISHPSVASANYAGKLALLTLTYIPNFVFKPWPTDFPKPTFRNGTELRFRIGGSGQFLTVPWDGVKWEVPGGGSGETTPVERENQNNRIFIAIREVELQWDFVDDPPLDDLDELMNKSNQDTFLGCPAETVLFENYSVEETFRVVATNPHTNRVTVHLRIRKIKDGSNIYGWNHDFSSEHGWARMLFQNDEPRYPLATFANMFA